MLLAYIPFINWLKELVCECIKIKEGKIMALSIRDFARLLLIICAKKTSKIDLSRPQVRTAYIPFNYRQRIENILCANNGWEKEFAILIDVDYYLEDHFWWEENLAEEILGVAEEYQKEISYDLVSELLSIDFFAFEIKMTERYYNENVVKTMERFVNLLLDAIYSRRFQEEFIDYSARTVRRMHDMNKNRE